VSLRWDQNAGHHSALYGKYKSDYLSIDFIVNYFQEKGAPRDKLVVGLASYGRSSGKFTWTSLPTGCRH